VIGFTLMTLLSTPVVGIPLVAQHAVAATSHTTLRLSSASADERQRQAGWT
jgi:hypothetical protein